MSSSRLKACAAATALCGPTTLIQQASAPDGRDAAIVGEFNVPFALRPFDGEAGQPSVRAFFLAARSRIDPAAQQDFACVDRWVNARPLLTAR
jgi:hypothetical protein